MHRHACRVGTLVPSLLVLSTALTAAETVAPPADGVEPITITAPDEPLAERRIALDPARGPVAADGAAGLRGIAGFDLARMGGHGLDPVLRGQQQGRLQVLLAGAAARGGCPNRMDPASAYAGSERYDTILVRHGVTTLAGLLPTPAGGVDFRREAPETGIHGHARLRAVGNGAGRGAAGELAAGDPAGHARLAADWEEARDYHDGEGRAVRSGYRSRAGGLDLGLRSAGVDAGVDAAVVEIEDARFAGAGMDSPESQMVRLATRGEWRGGGDGPLRGANWSLARAAVDHLMDNYSLRPLTSPVALRAPTTSEVHSGHADLTLALGGGELRLGLAGTRVRQEASRYAGPAPGAVDALQSLLWPKVRIGTWGGYAEYRRELGSRFDLRLGLRADRVDSRARDHAVDPAPIGMQDPPSPDQLATSYYGSGQDRAEDDLFGGLLRLGWHHADSGVAAVVAASRLDRAPDATERFLAAWSPMATMRWVGNPQLDPERHHQLELGLAWRGEAWRLELRAFHDDVEDWILRDTARGQPGILQADGASIYRQVDATLRGGELVARWRAAQLELGADVGYVRGDNDSDDTPLPRVPPLGGRLFATWHAAQWSLGGYCDWADRQDRIDPDSGLDLGETAGYAVFGLYASSILDHGLELTAGVDNLFDLGYARHLNRASAFDPSVTRVMEPGLQAWVAGTWSF